MPFETTREPIILRPQPEPFNFTDKWNDPLWRKCGVYLWSVHYPTCFLTSYVGRTFGKSTNFSKRIWQEHNRWRKGKDYAVDIEKYKVGLRCELSVRPEGHLATELAELLPVQRLWLFELPTKAECIQVERWVVNQLCKTPLTRQFLANRQPDGKRYQPDPGWPVRIDDSPAFRIAGLTLSCSQV
jgi:hypothetical protein